MELEDAHNGTDFGRKDCSLASRIGITEYLAFSLFDLVINKTVNED